MQKTLNEEKLMDKLERVEQEPWADVVDGVSFKAVPRMPMLCEEGRGLWQDGHCPGQARQQREGAPWCGPQSVVTVQGNPGPRGEHSPPPC